MTAADRESLLADLIDYEAARLRALAAEETRKESDDIALGDGISAGYHREKSRIFYAMAAMVERVTGPLVIKG